MNDERDERELSVNDSDDPCESDAQASGDTQEPDAAAPQTVYEWDYRRQLREDEQEARKGRRSGVVTFAVVMSVCFVLTLGVLIAALALGGFDAPEGQGGTIQTGDADGQALSLQQISERGKEVVVAISVRTATQRGTGTGIVMTSNGYIATNAHVVANAQQITVKLYNGRTYDATLIGMSEIDDLAVIQINAYGLKTATFGDSDAAVEGDRAVVIG
ncbi:MAG: trypsin-like peptidase domain-containing protein, partial [Clostridia bacterium]|nr:trypsin-like peptidase domain-containing protein [Clostridia bacterium]